MNPHSSHSGSITTMAQNFWRNRRLILQLTQREVVGRYRGSMVGLAWSFFNPMLMLLVYTFVFSVVFKARWNGNVDESKSAFAIILFVGMIVHGLFAECINRAPGLILSNANFVKKVVFPIDILPWTALGSALFHAACSLIVLLLAQLMLNHSVPWTALFFPFILLPLLLATIGFAWFLAALGVYVRDIAQVTGIFTTVLMFLSPVFYPVSALPEKFHMYLQLNPLTFIIEEGRKVLIYGQLPNMTGWLIAMAVGLAIASVGFWWFQKSRTGFADVI